MSDTVTLTLSTAPKMQGNLSTKHHSARSVSSPTIHHSRHWYYGVARSRGRGPNPVVDEDMGLGRPQLSAIPRRRS